jgi:hypothetical protein
VAEPIHDSSPPAEPSGPQSETNPFYPFSDELSFWYPFTLTVAAFAPSPLSLMAAAAATAIGLRMIVGLSSIREPLAAEDVGSARFLVVATGVLALGTAMSGSGFLGLILVTSAMFLFNSLHNVRTMVRVGKQRRRGIEKKSEEPPPAG